MKQTTLQRAIERLLDNEGTAVLRSGGCGDTLIAYDRERRRIFAKYSKQKTKG